LFKLLFWHWEKRKEKEGGEKKKREEGDTMF